MLLFYRDRLAWTILLIPAIAVVQFAFTLAVAILVAAVNVFFRDVGNVARHVLRLWFYLSPALDDRQPSWTGLVVLLAISVVLIGASTYVFKRMEPSFAKVL